MLKIVIQAGISFLSIFMVTGNVCADRCPTPDEVRERKISQDYEWTVDDRVTLDGLLSVKQLYAVRIKDNGRFVSCNYSTEKRLISLDGLPNKGECSIVTSVGEWHGTENGELVCQEKDSTQCHFQFECAQKENEGID